MKSICAIIVLMRYDNITQAIGNTPVVRLSHMFPEHCVWMKVERMNPGGSLKDRIALGMINDAEKRGIIFPGATIVEPTSGNTGIGLAMVGAVRGYNVILVMSEAMSLERRKVMLAYGATLVLTPKELGTKGAIEKAKKIIQEDPTIWAPFQHSNRANIRTHLETTAQEVINDFPEGVSYLVTGSGTGGHISGLAIALKRKFPAIKVYAVEPSISPVISGGKPHSHNIAGISPGFIPENLLLDKIDGVLSVEEKHAMECTRMLPRQEGIFAGISTGAALSAVQQLISQHAPLQDEIILTINYDLGERYLSVDQLF